ncbi:MAG: hypothetical protein QXQ18_00695 [Candidatus Aenigmatarchaeota archaeon]
MNTFKNLFFIILFLIFLVSLPPVFAASFTASVSPSTVNAGSTNTLNFTISNTDTLNITQVNITLPAGFSYVGGTGTTVDSSLVSFSGTFWWNQTPTGIIQNSTTQYFWFNAKSPNAIGTYNFNVTVQDINGNYNSTNVQVNVNDQDAPTWSSNQTSPPTGVNYTSGRLYQFNISWVDNVGIDKVLIEHNFTGALTNYTVSNVSGSTYYYFFSDLAAGKYVYKWYANDTSGNINSTPQFFYDVTKAPNPVNLYINNNLNQNVVLFNGTLVNITATSIGNVVIYQNGSQVASGGNFASYTPTPTLGIGFYIFKANVTSNNANYTDNSTGATFNLTILYQPPRWSNNITSFPGSYSKTYTTFNITWFDDNDPSGFNVSLLEANFTGSATNYTMYRLSGTNTSSFQIILPAGTFYWKVYANNSYGSFNSTPMFIFTIQKATPSLTLIASPDWNVLPNTPTNVSCSSPVVDVVAKLYRNNVEVNNPDVQTFPSGEFNYVCNTTSTQNYTSNSVSNILRVSESVVNLTIIAIDFISTEQNSYNSTIVVIKNTGDITQNVNFTIEGIDATWYTLNATNKTILPGRTFSILANFTVGMFEIKDYNGIFKAASPNKTVIKSFTLRINPGIENKTFINNTFLIYQTEALKILEEINASKQKGLNTTLAEQNYTQLQQKLSEIENDMKSGDYFSAYQKLSDAKNLLEAIKSSLQKQPIEAFPVSISTSISTAISGFLIYIIIGGVALIGILVYLFWPTKTYAPPQYKAFRRVELKQVSNLIKKIKEKLWNLKNLLKKKPKTPAAQKEVEIKFNTEEAQNK